MQTDVDVSAAIIQPLSDFLGLENEMTVTVIAVTVCLLFLGLWWRSHHRLKHLQQQIDRLQHDFLVANSSAIGMGQQLMSLEKKWQTPVQSHAPLATEKPVKLTVVNTPVSSGDTFEGMPSNEVYETSRQLLAQGVDIHDVIKRSGLSYSEVSLMQSLVK